MDKFVVIICIVLSGIVGYFIGNASSEGKCVENLKQAARMNQALRAQLAFKDCE